MTFGSSRQQTIEYLTIITKRQGLFILRDKNIQMSATRDQYSVMHIIMHLPIRMYHNIVIIPKELANWANSLS